MQHILLILLQLVSILASLFRPGGPKALVAEYLFTGRWPPPSTCRLRAAVAERLLIRRSKKSERLPSRSRSYFNILPTYKKRIEATHTFAPVNSGDNGLFTLPPSLPSHSIWRNITLTDSKGFSGPEADLAWRGCRQGLPAHSNRSHFAHFECCCPVGTIRHNEVAPTTGRTIHPRFCTDAIRRSGAANQR